MSNLYYRGDWDKPLYVDCWTPGDLKKVIDERRREQLAEIKRLEQRIELMYELLAKDREIVP